MKGFQIQQKGERRISAALRIMLVVVLLAVQIGFVVAISYFMQEYLALAYAVVQVAALFLAIHIYNEPGELSYKLIWFILLLLAPPVGMILWFLWGGAAQKRHLPQNTKRFPDEPESVRMRSEIAVDKLTGFVHRQAPVRVAVKGEADVQVILPDVLLKGFDVGGAAAHVDVGAVWSVADDVGFGALGNDALALLDGLGCEVFDVIQADSAV